MERIAFNKKKIAGNIKSTVPNNNIDNKLSSNIKNKVSIKLPNSKNSTSDAVKSTISNFHVKNKTFSSRNNTHYCMFEIKLNYIKKYITNKYFKCYYGGLKTNCLYTKFKHFNNLYKLYNNNTYSNIIYKKYNIIYKYLNNPLNCLYIHIMNRTTNTWYFIRNNRYILSAKSAGTLSNLKKKEKWSFKSKKRLSKFFIKDVFATKFSNYNYIIFELESIRPYMIWMYPEKPFKYLKNIVRKKIMNKLKYRVRKFKRYKKKREKKKYI